MMEKKTDVEIRQILRPFQKLIEIADVCNFDDFTVTLTWDVYDLNRFHELESNLPHGKISFQKHNGKKQKIIVEVSTNLKKTAKSDINRDTEERIYNHLEDGFIAWQEENA